MFDWFTRPIRQFLGDDRSFRRILANSGWLFGSGMLVKALALAENVVLARMLGPRLYGVLALVVTVTMTVYYVVDARTWEAAIKFVTQFNQRGKQAHAAATLKLCLLIDLFAGLLVFAGIFVSADVISSVFVRDVAAAPALRIYAFSAIILIPSGTINAMLRVANRFNWIAYTQGIEGAFRLGAMLAVAAAGGGLIGVIWAYLVSSALGTAVTLAWGRRGARLLGLAPWGQSPLRLLREHYRRILKFAFFSSLAGTSRIIMARADILVLGWFAVPAQVGLYKLARSLAAPLAVVVKPMFAAVYPEISRLVEARSWKPLRDVQRKLTISFAAVVFPFCLIFTVAIGPLIHLFFGSEYAGSTLLAQVLVWHVVWTPLIWIPSYLLSLGKEMVLAGIDWASAAAYMFILLLLSSLFQDVGAAIATVLCWVIWSLFALITVHSVNQRLKDRKEAVVSSTGRTVSFSRDLFGRR